jgi:hypothetical protein
MTEQSQYERAVAAYEERDYEPTQFEKTRYGAKDFADNSERDEFYQIQERAREVLEKNRKLMPEPGAWESSRGYRNRICDALKSNTDTFRRRVFTGEPEDVFRETEAEIYAQADANYLRPRDVEKGELVEITRTDPSGRKYSEFGTGQKGVSNPTQAPAQAWRSVFGQFIGPCYGNAIFKDGVQQPIGKFPDQRIKG